MGQKYNQLNSQDRFDLFFLLNTGYSKSEAAKKLGFHRATISREIIRNSNKYGYTPGLAEWAAQKRRHNKCAILANDFNLKGYIVNKLYLGWSPEQIAGRLKFENNGICVISHETIYKYIYSEEGITNKLFKCLRKKRSYRRPLVSRRKYNIIPNRVMIKDRPEEINSRKTFGHWEGDLMIFKRGISSNLITLRERKSRYMMAIKNESKHGSSTAQKIIDHMRDLKESTLSMTFDNGVEFCCHEEIANELNLNTYFCEPYKSYQKGSVENGNGVLRSLFPRDRDINLLDQELINAEIATINAKPMKCLGYQTPKELFSKHVKEVINA